LIGERLGAYTIVSELGSGGMGKVYLGEAADAATDADTPVRVAIKVVHPHLLEASGILERFLQEAEIGKRVRHENVVRTLDAGSAVVAGQRHEYLVMEYVEGRSLRELLIDLGQVPEALLRELAMQAAAGLAAIHAAGVIHRDIKPENVLITDAHEIRIMDLGVAKLQEVTLAIMKQGQFAGSLRYAAPEQFRGKDVGPAADLYSLGVMLYELATGQVPYGGQDAGAMIQAHLTESPVPAHERNEDISLLFSEVLSNLLAKLPRDRFASASALHAVLDEGPRSAWWIERAPALRQSAARLPRIRVGRKTKLYGRDDALDSLDAAWERASDGAGTTVLVEGEAGIGKTRLVDAFLRGVVGGDYHILYGSYPPSGGMGGLSDAILEKFGEAGLAEALAPYLTVTPSLVPTFAAHLKHEGPPTGAEPLQGAAMQSVFVHLMRALAAEKPTIWIVDDLHFAPQESRDVLLAMARALEDHPVLLVATARPGADVSDLGRLENFQRLPIGRLSPREVVHLLQDAFHSNTLGETLGGKIAVKSDGVPFFVFEMIRGLEEGQFIREQPDGTYVQTQVIDEIEVPSAVKDLIEGRMRGLTREQRAILDVGAVQGMSFESHLVARVLEEKPIRVLQDIAEIERRFGLVRGEAAACVFDQNQIQEVLYRDLLPELRVEYHTLLAEAHAARLSADARGDDAVFLVHHHLRGRQPGAALPHLELALDHLERGFRNDALLALAERALAVPGLLADAPRAEVLVRVAERLDLLRRRDEERAALDEALTLADATDDASLRARVRLAMTVLRIGLADIVAAEASGLEALELAQAAGDAQLEMRVTGALGALYFHAGRRAEAEEQFTLSRAQARELGDLAGEARAIGNISLVYRNQGRPEAALESGERAQRMMHELGDGSGEARAAGNLGLVFMALARDDEAWESMERGRTLSRETGDRLGEANAIGNLGGISMNRGHAAEALEYYERHRVLSREIGDRVGTGRACVNLSSVYLALGDVDEARTQATRALSIARELGNRAGEAYALHTLGAVAEEEGADAEALRLFGEALALRRELKLGVLAAETLVAMGRNEAKRGRVERAAEHLDEALALARAASADTLVLLATIERARLPGGDTATALAAFAEYGERAGHLEKLEARYRLWELTGDKAHLAEAHRLLEELRDHAPTGVQVSMIETVAMRQDIVKTWVEEFGGR